MILAIDPGTIQSAYVVWDGVSKPTDFGLIPNKEILNKIREKPDMVVIEEIRSYGMAVGIEVFDTVFWSGRFAQEAELRCIPWGRIPRQEIKTHLCNSARAKDANVIQSLIDRFAYNVPSKGKGTKKEPGFFYGFKKDIWQAFAVAVAWVDLKIKTQEA